LLNQGGGDTITGNEADDTILGDNGYITRNSSDAIEFIESIFPDKGGDDDIQGNAGDDVILGGQEQDTIEGNAGEDFILGDNGRFDYLANDGDTATLDVVNTFDPTIGAEDTIDAGDDEDIVFAGTADDLIFGGSGHDILFGDHAIFDSTLPTNQPAYSIDISDADGPGNDTIYGKAGDDLIYGQQGDDQLFGDDGEDDITGGHNVIGGDDGNDFIRGGEQADVILGDNGTIHRRVITTEPVHTWERYPAPFADVIREIIGFDDVDFISGDDTIFGDGGRDIMHGQRGDDTFDGGADDDEILGELGNDAIHGGSGPDTILGDVGQIIRAFNEDGSIQLNARGFWQRDIVLEEVGFVINLIDIDTTPPRQDLSLADEILRTDLTVLTGAFNPDGSRVRNADNNAWDTDMLLIDLVASNDDIVDGGAGEDVIFGQRGDDTLAGGEDSDLIIGDNASVLVQYETTIPQVIHGVRLIGVDADVPLNLEFFGSVIVPDAEIVPQELSLTKPMLDVVTDVAPELQAIATNDALVRTDGTSIVPFVSIVTDIGHHVDVLPGNDTINGGGGNDEIFGDNLKGFAPRHDTFKRIDDARDDVNDAFESVLERLRTLALDFAMAELGLEGVMHDPEVRIGNDTIHGDAGDDTIVGDDGTMITPASVRSALDPDHLAAEALKELDFLWNINHLLTDFELTIQEANLQVLNELVADAIGRNPQKKKIKAKDVITLAHHDLVLQNDVVHGDSGDDLIIGDHGVFVTLVTSSKQVRNDAWDPLDVSKTVEKQTKRALQDLDKARDRELDNHVKFGHRHFKGDGSDGGSDGDHDGQPKKKDLKLIPFEFAFDVKIGNDDLHGDDGEDVIIGDHGEVVLPAAMDTPPKKSEAKALNRALDAVLKDVKDLMRDEEPDGHIEHRFFKLGGSDAGSDGGSDGASDVTLYDDRIDGGADDDIIFGDGALIRPVFEEHVPAAQLEFVVEALPGGSDGSDGGSDGGGFVTVGDDLIKGSAGEDIIFGQGGDDTIDGDDGDDMLFGGRGRDTIHGGDGDDKLFGGPQHDKLVGGPGKDLVRQGGSDNDSDADEDLVVDVLDRNPSSEQDL
jgi:Ca2+-binding RTX toxin-like protein